MSTARVESLPPEPAHRHIVRRTVEACRLAKEAAGAAAEGIYHEVNASFGYAPEQLFRHLASAGHRLNHREENAGRTGLALFSTG